MSIYCTSVADVSLGEKDLKEDSREQGTADADVGLDTSSEDTEAEYKFVLIVVLPGTWHCVCTTNASFHVDRHRPGLTLGSSGYVFFCCCPSSVLRCTAGTFYYYYFTFILIFLKSTFERIASHQLCGSKSAVTIIMVFEFCPLNFDI